MVIPFVFVKTIPLKAREPGQSVRCSLCTGFEPQNSSKKVSVVMHPYNPSIGEMEMDGVLGLANQQASIACP